MTFFLQPAPEEIPVPTDFVSREPTGFLDGLGAATSQMMRDTNASWLREREVMAARGGLAQKAWERLGKPELPMQGGPRGVRFKALETEMGQRSVIEKARAAAAADPEAWKDIDLSDEGIEARVTEQRMKEDREEQAALEMMPKWRGTAEFLGGVAGATLDVRQIPFLLAGGGSGSFIKMLGREALLGAAGEAATLPDQFATAKELDKADPNVTQQLAFGAIGGAAFAGAIEGVARAAPRIASGFGRAMEYFRVREETPQGPDVIRHKAATSAFEDAIAAGEDPFDAVLRVMDGMPEPSEPLIRRDLEDPNYLAAQGEDISLQGPAFPEPQPPRPRGPRLEEVDQQITGLAQMLSEARSKDATGKKPLAAMMARPARLYDTVKVDGPNGPITRRIPKKPEVLPTKQVHPDGPFAAELRSMGITERTNPGLFSRNGRKDFDDLVASEMEESFPGIREATGTPPDAVYLDRDGFLQLLGRENSLDDTWLATRAEVRRLEQTLEETRQIRKDLENAKATAAEDYRAGHRTKNGYYVSPEKDIIDPEAMAREFDDWARELGYDLLPEERAEVLDELFKYGGDAEFLVERAFERSIERDIDALVRRQNDAEGSPDRQGGGGAGEPRPDGRGAREPDAGEAGLGEYAEGLKRDLYNDPLSPATQKHLDGMLEDFRAMVDAGDDFQIGFDSDGQHIGLFDDDGRPLNTLSDVLDEIDEMETLARELEACRVGGAE